jgi:exoribonuclease II
LSFDFRYNKKHVVDLLDRAREFLDTARECYAIRPAVACDLAFSAAELSVQAQMSLMRQRTKSHPQRRDWLESWAEQQNAPAEHAATLHRLNESRAAGRYADAPFFIDQQELSALLDVGGSMIETAVARSGGDAQ